MLTLVVQWLSSRGSSLVVPFLCAVMGYSTCFRCIVQWNSKRTSGGGGLRLVGYFRRVAHQK